MNSIKGKHVRGRLHCLTALCLSPMLALTLMFPALAHQSAIPLQSSPLQRASSTQTDEKDVRALVQGTPIERELTGGQAHAYSIQVEAGQFLGVVVEQKGIDVVVTLFAPDGKQLDEVDSPNGTQGPEPLSLVAKIAGSYRLEVRSLEKEVAAGHYEAKITALRDATIQDKTQQFAADLVAAKTEEERAALMATEKELVTAELSKLLNERGWRFFRQGEYTQALTAEILAKEIAEKIGDKKLAANALNDIGAIHAAQNNYAQALDSFQKSLALSEASEYKSGIVISVNGIGIVHAEQGNYAQALGYYQKSLALSESLGDKPKIAQILNNIGNLHAYQGNYAQSLEYHRKSLSMKETLGDKHGIAQTLGNIGTVSSLQGNYAQAMDYYQKSLGLRQAIEDKYGVAIMLNEIGIIHLYQGDYAQAMNYFQKSLVQKSAIGDKIGLANTLGAIGGVQLEQGHYAEALSYYLKALTLHEAVGDKHGIGLVLNEIGSVHRAEGNYAQALEYYRKSLALTEDLGDKEGIASTLNNIGIIYNKQGNHEQAMAIAERAVALGRQIGNRELWSALTTAGTAYGALSQPVKARQAFEEAIAAVEAVRTNVAGQEARASFFATARKPYELYIDLLMQLHKQHPSEGNNAVALQISERARARSLIEALSEARADIRQGVDSALLEREKTLQQQLNATATRQTGLLSGKHTEAQINVVKKELDVLTAEFQQVEEQIRKRSPRYAALTQPQPLSLREIQTDVLDADTLLLEYALGEERSYLWAVTQTSIKSYELPKRDEIESAVRRVYDLLSNGKQWSESDQINAQYVEAAGRLSQMLLAPVATQLQRKRLVIVGDGALQYLPFGALPAPMAQGSGISDQGSARKTPNRTRSPSSPPPLIVEHEIVSLPSASTLAVLRRETANRARGTKSIAVLADPVFDADDERVNSAMATNQKSGNKGIVEATSSTNSQTATASQSSVSRSLLLRAFDFQAANDTDDTTRAGELRIRRLPFTRREAEAILAIAPTAGMKALDFRASRETATNRDLAQYRIIHFATHGLLNSEHPELSGIVLSLVNETGQPVDGFLRLHEIYNLNLPADLVVLSACQTALGKEIRGEGLVGLTRGFMYAGAPRVVASLWKVDDAATAELMKRFYEGMLIRKMRPAEALRAAKVEMWKQKRWQAPFYWAAFELQGEWK